MAESSKIEWTDATWNPVVGCSVVSPGCANCYAMKLAGGRLQHHPSRAGLTSPSKAGPVWNGQVRLVEEWLDQPLRWKRPRRIFVCAHGDLFHDSVPDDWIDRVFAVMALAPGHTFQVLTKRSARMRAYLSDPGTPGRIARLLIDKCLIDRVWPLDQDTWPVQAIDDVDDPTDVTIAWPLPHVWLGVSAEDQTRADERIPDLLATPAAVRFVSAEPLLGELRLDRIAAPKYAPDDNSEGWKFNALDRDSDYYSLWDKDPCGPGLRCVDTGDGPYREHGLDWVIAGGESGPGARPMHPDWARGLRDQCDAASVPFFFKQWGDWSAFFDRDRDDPDWRDLPRLDGQMGRGAERWHNLAGGCGFHGERLVAMRNVGKVVAGRDLDGRTWDQMPGSV